MNYTDNLMSCHDKRFGMVSQHHLKAGRVFMLLLIVGIALVLVGSASAAGQERIPTTISIALDPAKPAADQGFFITGTLITDTGEPLGNKWITLESTAAGATPGKFQYLKVTRTERDGSYSFFRPAASPPEDLMVRFKGLYPYEASESEVVTAKK